MFFYGVGKRYRVRSEYWLQLYYLRSVEYFNFVWLGQDSR